MRSPTKLMAGVASGVFAVGAAAGWMAPSLFKSAQADTVSNAAAAVNPSDPIPLGTAPNYRAIVAQNRDSVVGITTAGETKVSAELGGANPFGNDDDNPLSQFFRQMPRPRGQSQMPMHAQGSGFIVSSDGIVLTNAHVVDGAKEVTVKLIDRREFKAKVLGADKTSDIAVLKIEAHGLPAVRMGNSDKLGVGDYVLAIGAPFGLEETATAGIVSATGRSLPGDGAVPFIQTDAAVNPGNSGGPLFDSSGAVVGINSQIYTNSGGYQGVSFAIPDQSRARRGTADREDRQSRARPSRHRDPKHQSVAGAVLQVELALRRARRPSRAGQRRRPCGNQGGRRDRKDQRHRDRRLGPVVGARQRDRAGREGDARCDARRQADDHHRDRRLGGQRGRRQKRRYGTRGIASWNEVASALAV